jgi:hypothetical protein
MATDYQALAQEHRREYGEGDSHLRIYRRLYADKTHFVYELIQNAEDAESRHFGLILQDGELWAWNDGKPFTPTNVKAICSVGKSDKELTQIGTFGIGFKAVYAYTDCPEIYSGEERFCIRRFVEPAALNGVPDGFSELLSEGKTLFRLPFRQLPLEDIQHLRERLRRLGHHTLLFLRHLESIKWCDEANGESACYQCHRSSFRNIAGAQRVEFAQVEGEFPREEWLVFRQDKTPPCDVINKLLEAAEDDDERKRIHNSAQRSQPIEVAFALQGEQIVPSERCVLFAYLPTEKETHLRFLIQARYQTTPARDNIPTDSPWNAWLVKETADFLPHVLQQLKDARLLTPSFFDVLPLDEDGVPEMLQPIAESLKKTICSGEFIPTQSGGYARPDQVFYPHAGDLRKLLKQKDLAELTKVEGAIWLHPDIRHTEEHRRRFAVVRAAGVREVDARQLVDWLAAKGAEWLEGKSDDWLRNLYAYLNRQEAVWNSLRTLPLVRLENGRHVCAATEQVFFPPQQDEERQELAPFLNELPFVRSTLLQGEQRSEVESFLKKMGVEPLRPERVIRGFLLPMYQTDRVLPSNDNERNRLHLRYLKRVWGRMPANEQKSLREEIAQLPILLAHKGVQGEERSFVRPSKIYLPQAYTGSPDLETYFAPCSEVWFVDNGYLEPDDKVEEWRKFLKELGCADLPRIREARIRKSEVERNRFQEECQKRNIQSSDWDNPDNITDRLLEGLDAALETIMEGERDTQTMAKTIWLLLKGIAPSAYPARDQFFKGSYDLYGPRGGYRGSRHFDATFYRQLKETTWLPDEHGNSHPPSKLFAPSTENRRLLGNSVAYLHPDFDLTDKPENEPARWLARQLGIHLDADTENVLKYLRSLSVSDTDVEAKDVEPLYNFLYQQRAQRSEEFQQEALIFTPTPKPRWWRAHEVFWEDESAVFGDQRGYLKGHYPESLKAFFVGVSVSERASPLDYARAVRELADGGAVDDEIRERLRILYRRLWQALQDGNDLQNSQEWKAVRDGRCWLGRRGSEWGFFHRTELVWNDHPYLAKCFEGHIPFWAFDAAFDALTDLAKQLEVKPISQAAVRFEPRGNKDYLDVEKQLQVFADDIRCLLESPRWAPQRREGTSLPILSSVRVCLVEEAHVIYSLNGVSVPDPEPRSSHFDAETTTVYLAIGAETREYPDLIGDALQDYFGVHELREFVKDLLTAGTEEREKVLARWRRRGLEVKEVEQTEHPEPSEGEATEAEQTSMPLPSQEGAMSPSTPTNGEQPALPTVPTRERTPEIVPVTSSPTWRGHSERGSQAVSQGGARSHSGGGGSGEGDKHRELKERLAANPLLLGEGLTLVGTEYEFPSGDRVDILLEDNTGQPVTVEVEPQIPPENYVGVWQAVKYKHLAAVERELPCEQVRSILAAPHIPDDVKRKCRELGVEPKEVPE